MNSEDSNNINERSGYLLTYAQIVFNQVKRFQILDNDNNAESYEGWMKYTQSSQIESEKRECHILSIISTALFLEAYIFDYGARKESGSYIKKYLDKLDSVSKWIVVTRLVKPPGIPKDNHEIENLKKIFKCRNELAHHKTAPNGNLWEIPVLSETVTPKFCLQTMYNLLELNIQNDSDDHVAKFILKHIQSWDEYASKDSRFYPIIWEA